MTSAVMQSCTSIRLHSREAQISAASMQLYNSSWTMLLMLTLATVSSHCTATKRWDECVVSAQLATCTAGQPPCLARQTAVAVLSAAAARCASTSPWLPTKDPVVAAQWDYENNGTPDTVVAQGYSACCSTLCCLWP